MSDIEKISSLLKLISLNVIHFRKVRGMTQDDLALASEMDRTYIGLIENAKQNISLSKLVDLARALEIELITLLSPNTGALDNISDIEKFNVSFPYIMEFQQLANKYEINDVFQDNGGKLLQVLLVTGLQNIKSREGNDAVNPATGREYELKSVNIKLTKSFSTHHHLNPTIIAKYRQVDWIFSVYEDVELKRIYLLTPDQLEPWFSRYENEWNIHQKDFNNPKIPLKFVETNGTLIFETPKDGQLKQIKI